MQLPENFHLAVIMDGNGRWGQRHGLSRVSGHEAGMKRIDELFEAATEFGVKHLTLFAFSTENWQRSKLEVNGLMRIFRDYITRESERLLGENVRVRFIGDKAPFARDLIKAMTSLEEKTAQNSGLYLNVAMNYGGHDELLRVMRKLAEDGLSPAQIDAAAVEARLDTAGVPPVDLMVRTSGESRISNFMLWQLAYAELYFTETLWPDFDRDALKLALETFAERTRRFGGN